MLLGEIDRDNDDVVIEVVAILVQVVVSVVPSFCRYCSKKSAVSSSDNVTVEG